MLVFWRTFLMSKGQILQDPFLNALRKDRIPVSIFLVNGIKLQGQIESFDQYAVLLKNTVSQMVYKHAISTIVPTRNPRADGSTPATGTFPASNAGAGYPMGGGMGSVGFDRPAGAGFSSGFSNARQGGFTRTTNTGYPNQGFDRSGYQNQGFEQGGFRQNQGFDRGGFDRSSYEERGFDGKTFEPQSKDFDKKGFGSNDDYDDK